MKSMQLTGLAAGCAAVGIMAMVAGAPSATASSGTAADGACPPPFVSVPADSDLRQHIDALTGSIDGTICAIELNEAAPFPRNLIDNMMR